MNRINLNKKYLYLFLLIPFFEPMCFNEMDNNFIFFIDRLYTILQIIACIYIFILYSIKNKMNKVILYIIIYWIIIFYFTYTNNGDLFSLIVKGVGLITVCLLIDTSISTNFVDLLKAFLIIFNILTIFNFLTIIIFPNGMYQNIHLDNWFLGNRNGHIFINLFTIYINFIYSWYINKKNNYLKIVIILIIIFSTFLIWSATSIIALSIVLMLLFCPIDIIYRKISLFSIVMTNIIISFLLSFYKIQYYFKPFIETILQRKANLSKREFIWNLGVEKIKENIFIGQGFLKNEEIRRMIGQVDMHNQFLDIFFIGGIFLVFIYIYFLFIVSKKNESSKSFYLKNLNKTVLVGYFVEFLVESKKNPVYFFIILLFSYHSNKIIIERKKYLLKMKKL